jgi:hypothetical protein
MDDLSSLDLHITERVRETRPPQLGEDRRWGTLQDRQSLTPPGYSSPVIGMQVDEDADVQMTRARS